MRHLRSLAPLALAALALAGCGSGSDSSSATPTAGPANQLEVRPVYARYASGVPLGPEIPKSLLNELSHQKCPTKPRDVQGMLLECDAGKTVYLLKDALVTGGVSAATASQIGHSKIWYIKVQLDSSAAKSLDTALRPLQGTQVALSYGGVVLTSPIVDSSFNADHLAVIGNYDEAQAKKLAGQLAANGS